jgi:hypothetical protein
MRMQAKLTPLNGSDDRLHPRRLVRLRARCEDAGARALQAYVVDLSEKGCRREGAGTLDEGDTFLIRLPGLEARPCRVVWVDRDTVGCEFDTPLYSGERELVRAQGGPVNKVRTGVFGRPTPGATRLR